ncbi:MAG: hypothetical protein ACRDRE_17730 [Pseudonocardiaceae bacterium]
MPVNSEFQVATAVLEDIETTDRCITFRYNLDGEPDVLRFEYESICLDDMKLRVSHEAFHAYTVSLGVISMGRFGAVIPQRFDIARFGEYVHPELLRFLRKVLCQHWSEHRYQIGRLDYYVPDFVVDESTLGSKVSLPLFEIETSHPERVLVATGSGKDSLLCVQLLTAANVEYETFTYLHDAYGDVDHQSRVFGRLREAAQKRHVLKIFDGYASWLENRLQSFGVLGSMAKDGLTKPFRTESGEVFAGSFAMVPIQVASGIPLQVFGNEKSADFPNLIDQETGASIAHQFAKSIYGETAIFNFYDKFFSGIQRVSLTKPIHDVKIFKILFVLTEGLPYLTNSCNFMKPWCCKCEKCLYVFSGFSAFGDHRRTVQVFGADLFDESGLLPVWEDLLGLNGRIPWECVGHPEEAQLNFYKVWKNGTTGCAVDMFVDKIIKPLVKIDAEGVEPHFEMIEERYSRVDKHHHHMPDWLARKIFAVLDGL